MYVYLIFKSTKDVILKIKSITKSCILDSQESFMEIPNTNKYMKKLTIDTINTKIISNLAKKNVISPKND